MVIVKNITVLAIAHKSSPGVQMSIKTISRENITGFLLKRLLFFSVIKSNLTLINKLRQISKTLLRLVLVMPFFLYAADPPNNQENIKIPIKTQPGSIRIDYQQISMPNDLNNMGLAGLHYLAHLNNYVSFGGGFLGSVMGDEGGFVTFGIDANIKVPLWHRFYTEAGLYFGGGGSSGLSRNGMAINTHIGLGYQCGNRIGLGVSYAALNFPDGAIHSQQVLFTLDVPFDFRYAPYSALGQRITDPNQLVFVDDDAYGGYNYISFLANSTFPSNASTTKSGDQLTSSQQYIGTELGHYFNKNTFAFIQTEAMLRGGAIGYMHLLGGLGRSYALSHRFYIVPQLGLGAGGGGGLDTGGGLLIFPQLSLEALLTSHFAASISGGYIIAPGGNFKAMTAGMVVKYYINSNPTISSGDNENRFFQGWRLNVGNETYSHPQCQEGCGSVSMIQGQLDYLINPYIYFSGQTNFAYLGNGGSYAEGLIGIGVQTPALLNGRLKIFTQLFSGAGGSGSVSVEKAQGFIVKPSVGALLAITDHFAIKTNLGQMFAINGKWHTMFFGVGISYRFSTLVAS